MKALYHQFSRSTVDQNGALTSFSIRCPDNFNVAYDVVDVMAACQPDKVAFIWCNQQGEENILTFGELRDLSNQAAHYLKGKGVRQGDRVMVMVKRQDDYWYIMLALHKLGALAVPAACLLTAGELVYRIQSAGIRAIICTGDPKVLTQVQEAVKSTQTVQLLFTVRGDGPGFFRLDTGMANMSRSFDRVPTRSTDPFLLYFTAGTTGYPKAVIHDYAYPLAHIITAKYWQQATEDGVHLTVADTGWAKATWGTTYGQWLCGSAVMVYDYDQFSPEELMRVVARYRVTTFCAPPTVYRLLAKCGLKNYDFSSLRHLTAAGEALGADIIRQFYEHTGLEIKEGYGQTETTLLIGHLSGMPPRPGSLGKPSPLYSIKVVDEEGEEVPPGQIGEVIVLPTGRRNYGLYIGYDNDPHAQARAWENGVYHTGDLAYYDEDGYYWYVSRKDDIIKSSGYRIGPYEVESALIQHPAVLECVVTGVPDPDRGCLVKATVVLQKGYRASEALVKELKQFVKKVAAPYKCPRIIQFVEQLPKTISGKIQRDAIRRADKKSLV